MGRGGRHSVPGELRGLPLGDASNRNLAVGKPLAPAAPQKSSAAGPSPALQPGAGAAGSADAEATRCKQALPAAPRPLPGLEEDGMPLDDQGQLPLPSESPASSSIAAYGNAFGPSLRVTSITRSSAARKVSTLRLVRQPDADDGRLLAALPPGERVRIHARTLPLREPGHRRGAVAGGQPSSRTSTVGGSQGASSSGSSVAGPLAAEHADAVPLPASPAEPAPQQKEGPTPAVAEDAGIQAQPGAEAPCSSAGGGSERPPPLPLPLPVLPGMSAPLSFQLMQEANCDGKAAAACPDDLNPACQAPVLSAPGSPAWLAQQGCRNFSGERLEPSPVLVVRRPQAAAWWRSQWLAGLQYHNGVRAGQPVKAGSPWAFVPLDPNEPLLEALMFHSAVMPEAVVAGAARFQDILLGRPELFDEAARHGVFSCGVWGVAAPDGTYQLLAGGAQLALPISLRRAPPPTTALFLACIWHEANRAEAAQHMVHTFGAGGSRCTDEALLKYSPAELLGWVRLVVGSEQVAEASLANLARLAVFGMD